MPLLRAAGATVRAWRVAARSRGGARSSIATGRDELRRFDERSSAARASGEFTIPMALGVRRRLAAGSRCRSPIGSRRTGFARRRCAGTPSTRRATTTARSRATRRRGRECTTSRRASRRSRGRSPGRRAMPGSRGDSPRSSPDHDHRRAGAPYRHPNGRSGWRVRAGDAEIACEDVIFAAPTFLAPYVVRGGMRAPASTYSPWLVANLTLDRWPRRAWRAAGMGQRASLRAGLGYVVATHQSLRAHDDGPSVWTYYHALASRDPVTERATWLAAHGGESWVERIMMELEVAHPNIRRCVTHVDIMRLGPRDGATNGRFSGVATRRATGSGHRAGSTSPIRTSVGSRCSKRRSTAASPPRMQFSPRTCGDDAEDGAGPRSFLVTCQCPSHASRPSFAAPRRCCSGRIGSAACSPAGWRSCCSSSPYRTSRSLVGALAGLTATWRSSAWRRGGCCIGSA